MFKRLTENLSKSLNHILNLDLNVTSTQKKKKNNKHLCEANATIRSLTLK